MKNFTSGFTLIETLIAISILTLSTIGPMVAASRAVVAAGTARDQLSASYLAQEGIEYAHAVRDDHFLALYPATANAWTNFINSSALAPCRAPNICTLGPLQGNTLSLCQGSGCSAPFSLLSPGGTLFTRTIQMVDVTATDERIISKVSWSFHGAPYSVTVTSHLTPWQ